MMPPIAGRPPPASGGVAMRSSWWPAASAMIVSEEPAPRAITRWPSPRSRIARMPMALMVSPEPSSPALGARSYTATATPLRASVMPADSPPMPAPAMTASLTTAMWLHLATTRPGSAGAGRRCRRPCRARRRICRWERQVRRRRARRRRGTGCRRYVLRR